MLHDAAITRCNLKSIGRLIGAMAFGGAFYLGGAAPSLAQYRVVDLGATAPNQPSVAFTIDDAGNAVGYIGTSSNFQAVKWTNLTSTPQMTKLGPTDQNSIAFSSNAASGGAVIVGQINPTGFQQAVQFTSNVLKLDKPADDKNIFNIAYNSNKLKQIVGVAGLVNDAPNAHAVVFSTNSNHSPFDLGNFGTDNAFAYDINVDKDGVSNVVGSAATASGPVHAFKHAGVASKLVKNTDDLGTLGGLNSEATCINFFNQVAGWSNLKCSAGKAISHAFLWQDGTMQDLGSPYPTLPQAIRDQTGQRRAVQRISLFTRLQNTSDHEGGECMNGQFVNGKPRPQIVGYMLLYWGQNPNISATCTTDNTARLKTFTRAFLYDDSKRGAAKIQDLNNLIPAGSGWFLQYAFGINNSKQIVGQGLLNGKQHAFLLLPN
jgi:probable HAF family extracellular repeat protein